MKRIDDQEDGQIPLPVQAPFTLQLLPQALTEEEEHCSQSLQDPVDGGLLGLNNQNEVRNSITHTSMQTFSPPPPTPTPLREVNNNIKSSHELECVVCHELPDDPAMIDCGHIFCVSCLQNQRTCTTCQKPIVNSSTSTETIQTLRQVLKNLKTQILPPKPTCSFCDGPPVKYCKTCNKFLCSQEEEKHKVDQFTKDHHHSLAEAKCRTYLRMCSKHNLKNLKYFCATCDTSICQDCVILEHQGHYLISFDVAAKKNRIEIENYLYHLMKEVDLRTVNLESSEKKIIELERQLQSLKNTIQADKLKKQQVLLQLSAIDYALQNLDSVSLILAKTPIIRLSSINELLVDTANHQPSNIRNNPHIKVIAQCEREDNQCDPLMSVDSNYIAIVLRSKSEVNLLNKKGDLVEQFTYSPKNRPKQVLLYNNMLILLCDKLLVMHDLKGTLLNEILLSDISSSLYSTDSISACDNNGKIAFLHQNQPCTMNLNDENKTITRINFQPNSNQSEINSFKTDMCFGNIFMIVNKQTFAHILPSLTCNMRDLESVPLAHTVTPNGKAYFITSKNSFKLTLTVFEYGSKCDWENKELSFSLPKNSVLRGMEIDNGNIILWIASRSTAPNKDVTIYILNQLGQTLYKQQLDRLDFHKDIVKLQMSEGKILILTDTSKLIEMCFL